MAPDHKGIFLGIEVRSGLERGPGSWKFNNTLLDDENYNDLIRFIYPQIREKYKDVESKQLLWELIKMEIRAKTIKFSKTKRSELKKRELTLQTELEELDRKICNSTNMDLVMYQPLSEGGTNFIDFRTMVKSLRLAWIKRLLTNSYDAWKAIPYIFLTNMGA